MHMISFFTKNKVLCFTLILTISFASGCSSNSETNAINSQESSSANSDSNSSSTWETGQIQDSDGYSVICSSKLDDGTKLCKFNYYVKNISKIPQSFDGDAFAESSDGTIYKNFSNSTSGAGELNPGEVSNRGPEFYLPVGVTIVRVFKAYSATDLHFYDVDFNVTISDN